MEEHLFVRKVQMLWVYFVRLGIAKFLVLFLETCQIAGGLMVDVLHYKGLRSIVNLGFCDCSLETSFA